VSADDPAFALLSANRTAAARSRARRARSLVTLTAMPMPVVLLHGFAGTARHWDRVIAELPEGRFAPLALNLADADPLTPDGVARLVSSATAAEPAILVGYSMGGRLALHAALAMPDRILRLVLVSASAGIEDRSVRDARRVADDALAGEIEGNSIDAFISRWRGQGLFVHDPDHVAEEIAADERRCTPAGLAAMLRGLGPGAIAPMWDRLGELTMGVAILAGELDPAYVKHGRRIAAGVARATFRCVPGVGHRVALQAPREVARALCDTT
jgi:2-succinyl-6-hydroxy-2,4-cyclohexadiene-1-carboxylate synthase